MRERVAVPAPRSAKRSVVEIVIPPPPHDPTERELALTLDGWEARLFGERMFQYFVTRGLWHLQLWHPAARVSVLTPSRLTHGFYEAYPIARWKARAPTYDALVTRLSGVTHEPLPARSRVERLEHCLVDEIVRASTLSRRVLQ
jgi:hypothetical protein